MDLLTENYSYELPQSFIATTPLYPRDEAKLLVYNRKTDTIIHTQMKYLLDFLPTSCEIFLNDTRVIKARLFGTKEMHPNTTDNRVEQGGGKVELLFTKPLNETHFLVLIRGKVQVGSRLCFEEDLLATVTALHKDGSREVQFSQSNHLLCFDELVLILDKIGHIPLPPYMQREDTQEDEKDYQTLFAKQAGAVAAPTASLHFTPELFDALSSRYRTHTLTLHVGAGTFKPVDSISIDDHPMHSEYFDIPDASVKVIESTCPLLAIGTTVTRTIEYYVRTQETQGECNLFLHPHNPPKRVNHLLTNFHLPKSTLIMLVSAFIGRKKTLSLYHEAIEKNYRFFSYGDAMLIL